MQLPSLRHVEPPARRVEAGSAADAAELLRVLTARVRECDMDQWYDRLAAHTFSTRFVPLSVADARVLVAAHKKKTSGVSLTCAALLDEAITAFGGRAFVKLSSRSPKDATVAGERTRACYERLLAAGPHPPSDNDKLVALNRAHIDALCVGSATEALALLGASERVLDDLELALENLGGWSQQLVVREWAAVPLWAEVRGFVVDGALTALSQYFAPCRFAELQDAAVRARLVDGVRGVLAQIAPLLPGRTVVADFALVGTRVLVMELNPFHDYEGCGTSACMFDWRVDADVLAGRAPFEFRFVTHDAPNIKALVGTEWRGYF